MKNSSDTIGNRTRDLPACSAVPRPTAPPRAPRRLPVASAIFENTAAAGYVMDTVLHSKTTATDAVIIRSGDSDG